MKKKHCFLILVHKSPDLLGRIVRTLAVENHYFYVHVDKKWGSLTSFEESIGMVPNVNFITNRLPVYHCGISHLFALLNMFNEALNAAVEFDYFHVISGQDYPLRSNEQFDEFFERTEKSFMYIDHGDFEKQMREAYKVFANGWHLNNTSSKISKLYNSLHMAKISSYVLKRKPIKGYKGGWDWFSWSRNVVLYVMKVINENPKLVKRFNHTLCPTEHIFQTILYPCREELKIDINNPLRYVSWNAYRKVDNPYRPYNLNEMDYEKVIDSKAFFCRKVDETVSAKLLDMIDQQRGADYDINTKTYFV